ncbi:MAG TPA: hypothetical protein VNG51_27050 [Ktedonobacteraceae bacterium]|nr:hypothetical protein [Ktedonobacteraceae bacterium]
MYSQTAAMLEQFDNQHEFERMCADILIGLGYEDVVLVAPRGGSDGGKDITFRNQRGEKGLACVTLRKDITVKFKEDFAQRTVGEFDIYILFCTEYLTHKQKVDFAHYCLETLHAEFVPKDIEALRSLLDSSLTSIREKYLGIKDDKKELFETMLAKTREELQKEYQARLLLYKAHETNDLSTAETLVKQAVEVWPTIRLEEYLQLGIRNAQVVIDGLPLEFSSEYGQTHRVFTRDTLAPYTSKAITYLEETVLYGELLDAEGLMYLACIYGYQKQFSEMIKIIDKALKVDKEVQEAFRQPLRLEILLLSCGSDKSKVELVSQKLSIPPVTKEAFCSFITDFDIEGYSGYINWIAVKRSNMPGEKGVHIIKICPPYVQNGGLVSAYSQAYKSGQMEEITFSPQFVTIEDLYDILCHSFILVYPVNRE